MKNWLHNNSMASLPVDTLTRSTCVLWGLLLSTVVHATPLEDAYQCLGETNLSCAMEKRDLLIADNPTDVDVLQLHARTLFHQGEFSAVTAVLAQLAEQGVEMPDEGNFPARASEAAFTGMVQFSDKGVIVRHDPGIDRILVADAVHTLHQARSYYEPLFGGGPSYDVLVDIFPTAFRFMQASGIPYESVRTTGVIALSKWNRLLITSPRATAGGYAWMDTTVHEYIHWLVSYASKDKSPVWLQEGLAKYLEHQWRDSDAFYLSPKEQSLLATAAEEDSFVPFEKFKRSMAYLSSGEEAALAYAQVSTMVDFMLQRASLTQQDSDALERLMQRIAQGESANDVVADIAGFSNFTRFESEWKAFLRTLPLQKQEVGEQPVVLDTQGSVFETDAVLSKRMDLANLVRVGDLLMDQQFYEAALVEYTKANTADEPPSPLVLIRMAECYAKLGQTEQGRIQLETALSMYAENAAVQTAAGRLAVELGLPNPLQYWVHSHELNPYRLETQKTLIALYRQQNDDERVQHHTDILEVIQLGGLYNPLIVTKEKP